MCPFVCKYYLSDSDSWFWGTFRRRHLQKTLQLSCDMKGLYDTYWRDDHIKHDIQILQSDRPPISWRERESRSFRVSSKSESEPTSDSNSRTTNPDLKETGNWTKTDNWDADSWQYQTFRSRSFGALSVKPTSVSHRSEYLVFHIPRNLSHVIVWTMSSVFAARLQRGAFSEWIRISMPELTRKSISTNLVAPVFFWLIRWRRDSVKEAALLPHWRGQHGRHIPRPEKGKSLLLSTSLVVSRRPREEADTQHIPVITLLDPHPHHTHSRPDTWRWMREVLSQTRRALLSNVRVIFDWSQLPDNLMQNPTHRHSRVPSKRRHCVFTAMNDNVNGCTFLSRQKWNTKTYVSCPTQLVPK